jgi:CheY-like chemotaxis protein
MILARPSYDLAFIDIRMPEMNGFQLYNEMKKIDRVCFITAFDIQQIDMETISSSNKKSVNNLFKNPSQLNKWLKK